MLAFAVFFMVLPVFCNASSDIELSVYGSENIINGQGRSNAQTCTDTSIRFNISNIPSSSTITDALLCHWIIAQGETMDNDISMWRINNQTWNGSMSLADYQNMPLDNNVNTSTLNSTTTSTYTCFDVKTIIEVDYLLGNNYSSIRFEDPDFPTNTTYDHIEYKENRIGFIPITFFEFESGHNFGGTGKLPKLLINYSTLGKSDIDMWINGNLNQNVLLPVNTEANVTCKINVTSSLFDMVDNTTSVGSQTGQVKEYVDSLSSASHHVFNCSWDGNATHEGTWTEYTLTMDHLETVIIPKKHPMQVLLEETLNMFGNPTRWMIFIAIIGLLWFMLKVII